MCALSKDRGRAFLSLRARGQGQCFCVVFRLPWRRRHCLCLLFQLPSLSMSSRLRRCLGRVCSTAFAARTPPLPCHSRLRHRLSIAVHSCFHWLPFTGLATETPPCRRGSAPGRGRGAGRVGGDRSEARHVPVLLDCTAFPCVFIFHHLSHHLPRNFSVWVHLPSSCSRSFQSSFSSFSSHHVPVLYTALHSRLITSFSHRLSHRLAHLYHPLPSLPSPFPSSFP